LARAKRTVYVFFHCHDEVVPDIEAFFAGEARRTELRNVYAISLLTGEEFALTRGELELALAIPSTRWNEVEDRDEETVDSLARKGVVVTDSDEAALAALRSRDELLASSGWNLYGALHFLMTKWRDVDLRSAPQIDDFPLITREMVEKLLQLRGRPPDPFYAIDGARARVELPLTRPDGALYATLARRKTTRGYDRTRTLSIDELATVLDQVWGCHGTAPILDDVFCLKRTSPSGGCLHPIEVYPLVSRVAGIEPGLYHYNVRDHALDLLEPMTEADASELAATFVCGQAYFASAHVTFVMVARFPRNHWKYPKQQKAYPVVLMDAAHLSQTLYLVATELNLGAYVTVAINGLVIEERLRFDGITQGVVAVAGCGHPRQGRSPLEPDFAPYVPRETAI